MPRSITDRTRDCQPSPGSSLRIVGAARSCRSLFVSPDKPSFSGTPNQALAASRGDRHSGLPPCLACSNSSRASCALVTRSIAERPASEDTSIAPRLFGRRPNGTSPATLSWIPTYAETAFSNSATPAAAITASKSTRSSMLVHTANSTSPLDTAKLATKESWRRNDVSRWRMQVQRWRCGT